MYFPKKPGGDDPRFVLPDTAGDKLIAGLNSAEMSLHRDLDAEGRPAVCVQFRLTSNVEMADAALVLTALHQALLRARKPLLEDDRDETEGGAL